MPDLVPGRAERLTQRGVSRRQFLQFATFVAATLVLPAKFGGQIAEALASAPRVPVVWLGFLECTGDTESFLRASNPTVSKILLDLISLDYHATLMGPSGTMARKSLEDTVARYPGKYIAVVEGAIPRSVTLSFDLTRTRRFVIPHLAEAHPASCPP